VRFPTQTIELSNRQVERIGPSPSRPSYVLGPKDKAYDCRDWLLKDGDLVTVRMSDVDAVREGQTGTVVQRVRQEDRTYAIVDIDGDRHLINAWYLARM
jgi:hypothetical protein